MERSVQFNGGKFIARVAGLNISSLDVISVTLELH